MGNPPPPHTPHPARPPRPESSDRECDVLYRALFGRDAPDVIHRRFAEPSKQLDDATDDRVVRRYYLALERVRDIEALELACRLSRELPLLPRKLRLVVYLAEALPETQAQLVKRRVGRLAAIGAIFGACVRTALKLPLGLWQLRRLPRA